MTSVSKPSLNAVVSLGSNAHADAASVELPLSAPQSARVADSLVAHADDATSGTRGSAAALGRERVEGDTIKLSGFGAAAQDQASFRLVDAVPMDLARLRGVLLRYRPDLRSAPTEDVSAAVDALSEQLPEVLRTTLSTAAAACGAAVLPGSDGMIVQPTDALALCLELCRTASTPDGLGAFLLLQALEVRPRGQAARALRLARLLSEPSASDVSVLIDPHPLASSTRALLESLAAQVGLRVLEVGGTLLVGSGMSLQLNVDVLLEAAALNDGTLIKREARIGQFLSQRAIEIDTDYSQGSAGHYLPGDDSIGYVMPSRTNLNLLTHESTHARFERFQQRLTSWLAAKGYAVPYEIDGDPDALSMGYGSYMTLLNELNAHRVGNSFDGSVDDREILQKLQELYRRNVGDHAADGFAATWPEARVRGQSVPKLMLRAVRELNRLDEAAMLRLVARGWQEQAPGPLVSFLRLATVRFRGAPLPTDVLAWARRCLDEGPTSVVRASAQQLLAESPVSSPWHSEWKAKRAAFDDLAKGAQRWLRRVQAMATSGFWPATLLQRHASVLWYANRHSLDYAGTIAAINEAYGERIPPTDEGRRLFSEIAAMRGDALEEKLDAFAGAWAHRPLASLWQELHTAPTEELKQLLLGKHLVSLDNTHVCDLVRWALDGGEPAVVRQFAAEILTAVLNRAGLTPLGPGLDAARRNPDSASSPLSPALDELLAGQMLDGDAGIHRIRIMDLLQSRTYPQELPRLAQRLVRALTDDSALYNDHRLAAFFFLPETVDAKPALDWGRTLAGAVLGDATQNARAAELVTEFYRVAVSHALPGGLEEPTRFDAATRDVSDRAVAGWSPAARALLDEAVTSLWKLLASPLPQVGRGATYAIASHPAFVAGIEDKLATLLAGTSCQARTRALRLALMLEPGFSPVLDAAVHRLTAPSDEEQQLLRALSR